jgi:hypothetical protein
MLQEETFNYGKPKTPSTKTSFTSFAKELIWCSFLVQPTQLQI